MTFSLRRLVLATGCLLLAGNALAAEPKRPECIAPASPGGGFDLTCKLVQSALVQEKILSKPMRVTYMPGGVGAWRTTPWSPSARPTLAPWWPGPVVRC
jgi:Uncharacterized protein conserved in bacteria